MAVDHVKSTFITNADASPAVANTAGEGGPAAIRSIEGSAVGVASSSVASTYQFVRVPSNCKVKAIFFESAAQTAGALDLGLYFATDGVGGKPTALVAASAIDQDFFASAIVVSTAVSMTEVSDESTTYTFDKRTQPLWQAVGLTADPGGYFDVVGTVTTAFTTAAARMGVEVFYTD
jgi:hypothetical protein